MRPGPGAPGENDGGVFRVSYNDRLENRNNWSGVTNGIHATGNFLYRINKGGTWDRQGTAMCQWQTGAPLNFDSNYLFRRARNTVALPSDQQTMDRWFNTSGFETSSSKQLSSNYRAAPRQFPGVVSQTIHLWDMSVLKNFSIREGVRFQVRGEFLNASNHMQFDNPNLTPSSSSFGTISSQTSLPHDVQIGLKIIF